MAVADLTAPKKLLSSPVDRHQINRPLGEALGPHEGRRAERGRSSRRGRDARADAAQAAGRYVACPSSPYRGLLPELNRLVRGEDVVAVAGDDDRLLDPVRVELQPPGSTEGIQTRGDQGGLTDADPTRAAHRDLRGTGAGRERELLVIAAAAQTPGDSTRPS